MGRSRGLLAGVLTLLALPAAAAEARPRPDTIYEMMLGQPVPPPSGYSAFCLREPADCAVPGAPMAGPPLKPNHWAFAFRSAAVQKRFAYRARSHAEPPASIRRPALFRAHKASARPLPPPEGAPPGLDEAGRIVVTRQVRSTLNRVNRGVNRRVASAGDRENYGVTDFWALPLSGDGRRRGDCEDYVVEKRHQLLAAGYPMQALSIALVRTRWNDTHAVLLVETDEGALALDSLSGWIGPWWKLDYQWIMRQSPKDASTWVSVLGEGWSGQDALEPG